MAACRAEQDQDCAQCGGEGIVTRPGNTFAEAQLCSHMLACQACRGSGYRPARDSQGYDVMQPCDLVRIKAKAATYTRAEIPARYHAATLATFSHRGGNQSKVLMAFAHLTHTFERIVQPGGHLPTGTRGIGLSGPPGVGKTHLLVAMARNLVLDFGVRVKFTDFSHLLWSLKAGFDAGQGEDALIAPLVGTEVLFIDELGKGRASEWEQSILDAIVSARYNRRLTTFFATNYQLQEPRTLDANDAHRRFAGGEDKTPLQQSLASRIGERVVSRLTEMCDLHAIEGPDSRQVGAGVTDARKPAAAPRPGR